MPKDWGYWTEHKLEMLAAYLPEFTRASSNKARGTTIYLDLFAGAAENVSRTSGKAIDGSPRIALDTVPHFTKVYLFELPNKATALEADLAHRYPGRDFTVWPGDCNEKIDAALIELEQISWAPTFAFVDHLAAEIKWSTLEKLAAFKKGSKYKAEMWLLFAHSMLPRGLAALTWDAVEAFATRIDDMYGSRDWDAIYAARLDDRLDPGAFRYESTNLMRWRLENVLGYKRTHAFEMRNTNGSPLYTMIFATDNDAGDRIMTHIYGKAAERRPKMQAEAAAQRQARREEKLGIQGLFDPLPKQIASDKLYVHEPPTPPYGMSLRSPDNLG